MEVLPIIVSSSTPAHLANNPSRQHYGIARDFCIISASVRTGMAG
jgi:hypothetical protein